MRMRGGVSSPLPRSGNEWRRDACAEDVAACVRTEETPLRIGFRFGLLLPAAEMDEDILTTLKILIIGESGVGKSRWAY